MGKNEIEKPLIAVETGTVVQDDEEANADDRKTLLISLCTVAMSIPALIGA